MDVIVRSPWTVEGRFGGKRVSTKAAAQHRTMARQVYDENFTDHSD